MEMNLKEQHNRDIQKDIDLERVEIEKLKETKEKFIPEIMRLETRLNEINFEVKKLDIDISCRENRIQVLSDRFWKN